MAKRVSRSKKSSKRAKSSLKRKSPRSKNSDDGRTRIVLRNLIVFLALFVIFSFLTKVTTSDFYDMFFYLLAIILGFISLAFLIVLLVLLVMNKVK